MITVAIEEPKRVGEHIIARCRSQIDSNAKAFLRLLFIPIFRKLNGFSEIGEGFQGPRSGRVKVGNGSRVGRYAYIGPGFESQGPVVIGDLCLISRECCIIGNDHIFNIVGTPTRLGVPKEKRAITVFEADVWIGARTLIKEGVRIGEGAIVGSGSLVLHDVAPYTIVAGVPAKPLRSRLSAEELERHCAIMIKS
ncbi:galactoside O-acetyltransferase [Novosphingobium sp. Rr 2-17]|uniref:acyltransferase n=1 Tax=Novosphingobium sp. Rr 2-17 TaxID=555793 RepID=UPI0002699B92|nr:galactoside O-acetyltransferase [Novosphingobium sp. Rr 2-17]EIZ79791.1 galactoside O-acetyltransferase [Novosphingobium sp. Rr 2-17]